LCKKKNAAGVLVGIALTIGQFWRCPLKHLRVLEHGVLNYLGLLHNEADTACFLIVPLPFSRQQLIRLYFAFFFFFFGGLGV
jgi:hypothetical protein